ncbi:hypothetical protein CDAR_439561 [Caerostris darwini]|uniref:Uncharacterized protein n=1 Tax=Caerostris darwini TaxID=1538125 RepID=A0AAV4MJ24_9ARAC|nr:hypothetical protein CDAR_439561 [Caerostris darwini]
MQEPAKFGNNIIRGSALLRIHAGRQQFRSGPQFRSDPHWVYNNLEQTLPKMTHGPSFFNFEPNKGTFYFIALLLDLIKYSFESILLPVFELNSPRSETKLVHEHKHFN